MDHTPKPADAIESLPLTAEETEYLEAAAYSQRLDRRSLRLNKLLGQSSVRVLEFICADLGVKSPHGLDLKPVEDFELKIGVINGEGDPDRGKRRNKNLLNVLGAAIDKTVLLNPHLLKYAFHAETQKPTIDFFPGSTFSHEVIHTLQHRENEILGFSPLTANAFIGPALELPPLLSRKSMTQETLTARFNRCAENIKEVKTGYSLTDLFFKDDIQNMWKRAKNIPDYLAKDNEIQARLHQTLAAGHAAWQCMPSTKTELHAALYHCGAKMPDSILNPLRETPEGSSALETFALPEHIKPFASHKMDDINIISQYAGTQKSQENFWQYSIPGLYGHLLELYGDTLGRERMGLGKNKNDIVNVMRLVRESDPPDFDKLHEAAHAVSPENAVELAGMLIREFPENHPRYDIAIHALDLLLKNPATQEQVANPDRIDSFGKTVLLSPLMVAVLNGRGDIMKKLITAGANPLHKTTLHNLLNGTSEIMDLGGLVSHAKNLGVASESPTLKTLWRGWTRSEQRNALYKGLCALNDCPGIDRDARHMTGPSEGNPARETSFNELMAELGLKTPQNQRPAAPHKGVEIASHF